jgi:N-acetylglucosamine malate deacetylase 1
MKNILVLAPHADDMEFGCGGTIKRLVDEGAKVLVLVFSTCEESLPDGFTVDDIKREQIAAGKVLGIKEEDIKIYDFPVRRFDSYRQDILEILIQFKKHNNVNQVFTPSRSDIHQDHAVIYIEAIRAFKHSSLLGYEMPWNNIISSHNYFYKLDKEHMDAKQEAINCFKTQQHRGYTGKDIMNLAQVRGMQVKAKYAESFELVRWVEK